VIGAGTMAVGLAGCTAGTSTQAQESDLAKAHQAAQSDLDLRAALANGKRIFRFDTFGDEAFWGGVLRLHQAIEGSARGGVGEGVSPTTALSVGLKVDVDALDSDTVTALKTGKVDLNSPDTTLALLSKNAVVGVKGIPDGQGGLKSLGITCAFCHATVDDSFSPGIGHRLDGWPNLDLNVGAVINLSPDLTPVAQLLGVDQTTVRNVLQSWGPGRFDAELFTDGKAFRPDGQTAATLLPPAYGLTGVNLHTYTGWGSVPYWNAHVAIILMHGQGTFFDPRLDDASKFPVAAKNGFANIRSENDLVTPKLTDLHLYQLALPVPRPSILKSDPTAVARGNAVFTGPGKCATCHVPPQYTEPGWNMHTSQEIGIDDFQASRSPDDRYRTTPLRGLVAHGKRGYYHDGRFLTLPDVVDHYDSFLGLGLSTAQKADLVTFLKTL
jgi:hypothetical protein